MIIYQDLSSRKECNINSIVLNVPFLPQITVSLDFQKVYATYIKTPAVHPSLYLNKSSMPEHNSYQRKPKKTNQCQANLMSNPFIIKFSRHLISYIDLQFYNVSSISSNATRKHCTHMYWLIIYLQIIIEMYMCNKSQMKTKSSHVYVQTVL